MSMDDLEAVKNSISSAVDATSGIEKIRQNLYASANKNPDAIAKMQMQLGTVNLNPAAALDDIDGQVQAELIRQSFMKSVDFASFNDAPASRRWFMKPEKAAISHDVVPAFTRTEGLLKKRFGDAPREIASGFLSSIGATLEGGGRFSDIATKGYEITQNPIDFFISNPGRALSVFSEKYVRPPESRRDFMSEVYSGLGQVSKQVAQSIAVRNPYVLGGLFMAESLGYTKQDFDRQGYEDTSTRKAAELVNAGLVGLSERYGTTAILSSLPASSRGALSLQLVDYAKKAMPEKFAEAVLRVGIAGGVEWGTEFSQSIIQDIVEKIALDETKGIDFIDATDQGNVGGVTGLLFKSILEGVSGARNLRMQKFEKKTSETNKILDDLESVLSSEDVQKMKRRDPEGFREFLNDADGGENFYVDGKEMVSFFQSLSEEERVKILGQIDGLGDQLREAELAETDVIIRRGQFANLFANTPWVETLKQHIRTSPDELSAAEVEAIKNVDFDLDPLAPVQNEASGLEQRIISGLQNASVSYARAAPIAKLIAAGLRMAGRVDGIGGLRFNPDEMASRLKFVRLFSGVKTPDRITEIAQNLANLQNKIKKPPKRGLTSKEKIPVLSYVVNTKGQIDPDGEFGQFLKSIDITPKTHRWAFKKGGVGEVDNLDLSEFNANFPQHSVQVEGEIGSDYVPISSIHEAIDTEIRHGVEKDLTDRDVAENDFEDFVFSPYGLNLSTYEIENMTVEQLMEEIERFEAGSSREDTQSQSDEDLSSIKEVRDAEGRLLAPNGKPSKLNDSLWKVVRTPAFKEWFGDWENDPANASKVVDENGEPLVVYHGTNKDFDAFEYDKETRSGSWHGKGFYFSANPEEASEYSVTDFDFENGRKIYYGSTIYPVFLKINKPYFDTLDKTSGDFILTKKEVSEIANSLNTTTEAIISEYGSDGILTFGDLDLLNRASVAAGINVLQRNQDLQKSRGFDGVEADDGEYVVFDPNQIKSIHNRGTFSKSDDRILFQAANEDDKDLLIQHNISEKGLLHANKMGGIAVPSLAITKVSTPLSKFGEITLLGSPSMADPKTGIKVFGADIYSPRYPEISFDLDKEALKKINGLLDQYRADGVGVLYGGAINNLNDLMDYRAFREYSKEKLGDDATYDAMRKLAYDTLKEVGAKERIFTGFSPSGNRRYIEHNLENVVKILKSGLRGGENFNYGVGSLRAKFTPQFKSIAAIKGNKNRLVDRETFNKIRDEIDNDFLSIAEKLGVGIDSTIAILEDAPRMGLQKAFDTYERGGVLSEDTKVEIVKFLDRLKNLPTEYFEAKITRAVGIGEFAAAVVPDNIGNDAIKVLKDNGINEIRTYKAGDDADRKAKIAGFNNLLFQQARGSIVFSDVMNKVTKIVMTENADLSTVLHEIGHYFSLVHRAIAEDARVALERGGLSDGERAVLESFVKEWEKLKKAVGAKSNSLTVDQEEKIAKGFEQYLREGNPPSEDMRGVFQIFRSWLMYVYESIAKLGNPLNKDMREVFSRWFATEAEIKAASETTIRIQQIMEQFEKLDIKPDASIRAKVARYVNTAGMKATDKLYSEIVEEEAKKQTEEWKSDYKKTFEEVTKAANESNVYAAIDYIKAGHKLDKKIVQELVGVVAGRLPRGIRGGKTNPNSVAMMFGFVDGAQMLRAFASNPDKKAWIKQETDRLMKERYGNMFEDGRASERAKELMEGDEIGKILDLMAKTAGSKKQTRRVVKAASQQRIAGMKYSDVQPYKYASARDKAIRSAYQSTAKGDAGRSAQYLWQAMLNHELYLAAKNARDTVAKSMSLYKKINLPDSKLPKSWEGEYVYFARFLLSRVGLSNAKRFNPQEWLEKAMETNPALLEQLITANNPDGLPSGDWKTLRINDLTTLAAVVENVIHIGRESKTMDVDGRKQELKDVVSDIITNLSEQKYNTTLPPLSSTETIFGRAKELAFRLEGYLVKVESLCKHLDGGKSFGPMMNAIYRPISDAYNKTLPLKDKYMKKIVDLMKERDDKYSSSGSIYVEGLATSQFDGTFRTKWDLITALLNYGNESNREKLLKGYKWDESALLKAFSEHLTVEDVEFAQKIWDILENDIKPFVKQEYYERTGLYLEEIKPSSFELFGKTFAGGYYPITYSRRHLANDRINQKQEEENLFEANVDVGYAATAKGSTIARTSYYGPIDLDIHHVVRHAEQSVHRWGLSKAVRQTARLISNKEFKEAMAAINPAYKDMFMPWLRAIARDVIDNGDNSPEIQRLAKVGRVRSSLMIMGYNLRNAMQNLAGYPLVIDEIGAKYMLFGMSEFVKDQAAATEFINSRSNEMMFRYQNLDREQQEVLRSINAGKKVAFTKFGQKMAAHAYFISNITDAMVSRPAWLGAYKKYFDEHGADAKEEDAIFFADSAVRLAIGNGSIKDTARVQRGSELVRIAFAMFYSYMNMVYNRNRVLFLNLKRQGVKNIPEFLAGQMMVNMIPNLMAAAIVDAMGGGGEAADDEDWKLWYLQRTLSGYFGMVPVVGDIGEAVTNKIIGINSFDTYSTPVANMMQAMSDTMAYTYDAASGEDVNYSYATKQALNAATAVTGIPFGVFRDSLSTIVDWAEGDSKPDSVFEALLYLSTGAPPKQ